MNIISHRGYWTAPAEKNQDVAFRRALALGFGIETDIRDLAGELVISHDPAAAGAMPFSRFMALYLGYGDKGPLAINVKADGLHGLLNPYLADIARTQSFVFDMSVPDTLGYLKIDVPVFVRHSDIEPEPVLYGQAAGIWLDQFHSDWISTSDIARHLDRGKRVCLVSPELHRRDHRAQWEKLAKSDVRSHPGFMICTDFPEQARGLLP